MLKIILSNALIITIISAIHLSFVLGLPSFLSNSNIILVTLIFILIFRGFEPALYYSIAFGFILGIFLFAPFNFYIIIFTFVTIFSNFLLNNFFTNRSIYSFLSIGAITTITYTFLIKISQYLIIFFKKNELIFTFDYIFFINVLSSLFLNSLFIILMFFIINLFNKGLRPIFLKR